MGVRLARLEDVAEVRLGRQRSPKNHVGTQMRPYVRAANVGWDGLLLHDVKTMNFTDAEMNVYRLKSGDLLLGEASGSAREVGKPAIWSGEIEECAFQNTLLRVRPREVDPRYLLHFFKHEAGSGNFASRSKGVGIYHLGKEALASWLVPLPSFDEQQRIADILDRADALCARRRNAIAQIDILIQSVFLDMFGDPATNPKGWPIRAVGDMAHKISDGPFGSNLKTSHYTYHGVRVIRLTNIGIGKFLDHDAAFISDEYFRTLRKHECRPGDVLVATMGEPNLRACIQPDWLPVALNKADCVQVRANEAIATGPYICALLNLPSVERMAQDLILGETRLRISMGRLRTLILPVPPLSLQHEFSERISAVESLKAIQHDSLASLGSLFASLQHRAFRGKP